MKRTLQFLIGLVTIGLFTVSCSKEDMNDKNIEGKWQSTKIIYEYYEDGKLTGEKSETCIDWYYCFNFKSDGTGQEIYYERGESVTYQMTWVTMGDKLMLTIIDSQGESHPGTFDIIEIKSNSMILSSVWEDDGGLEKEVETIHFKKI